MKKILNHPVLASLLLFFLFIIFTVYPNIFTESELPSQLMAALLGAIITGFITIVLLKGQSEAEELKERNVKVFEQKAQKYNDFIKKLWKVWDDRKITLDEINELFTMISTELIIYSQQETTRTILDKLDKIIELTSPPKYNNHSGGYAEILKRKNMIKTHRIDDNEFISNAIKQISEMEIKIEEFKNKINNDFNNNNSEGKDINIEELRNEYSRLKENISKNENLLEIKYFELKQSLIQSYIFDIVNILSKEINMGGKIETEEKRLISKLEKRIIPHLNVVEYKKRFLEDFKSYIDGNFSNVEIKNLYRSEYIMLSTDFDGVKLIIGPISGRSFSMGILPREQIIGYYIERDKKKYFKEYLSYDEGQKKRMEERKLKKEEGNIGDEDKMRSLRYNPTERKLNILKDYKNLNDNSNNRRLNKSLSLVNFDKPDSVNKLIIDYHKYEEDNKGIIENPAKQLVDKIVEYHNDYLFYENKVPNYRHLRNKNGKTLDEIVKECDSIENIEKIESEEKLEREKRREEMRKSREERMSRRKSKNDTEEEVVNSDENDS